MQMGILFASAQRQGHKRLSKRILQKYSSRVHACIFSSQLARVLAPHRFYAGPKHARQSKTYHGNPVASTCQRFTQKWLIHNTLLIPRRLLTRRRRMPRYRRYVVTAFRAPFWGPAFVFAALPYKRHSPSRNGRKTAFVRVLTNETILISPFIRHRARGSLLRHDFIAVARACPNVAN